MQRKRRVKEANMKLTYEQIVSITQGAVYIEQHKKGIQFHRFTKEQEDMYARTELDPKQNATAGIRMEFQTDSTTLYMKVITSEGSRIKSFSHDIIVNGKYIGALNDKNKETFGQYEENFFLGVGKKIVSIHFPWSVNSVLQELRLDRKSFIEPIRRNKKLLAYGDSITQGFIAQHPSKRYVASLADALDAEEYNKAVGGEVFCPWLLEQKEEIVPDYISVAYGTNHWLSSSPKELRENCESFFEKLVEKYPTTQIFAITPIWRKDCTEITQFQNFEEIGKIITDVASKYEHVSCISGRNFLPEDETLYTDLYLHPNDEGFVRFSENLLKNIKTGE